MHWFSFGVASLVALAIIVIGAMYLANPRAATRSFGLPLPEDGANIVWWLRLKGVRDGASGAVLLAMMALADPFLVGIVLLILAMIPLGDMSLILAARGSTRTALSVHGVTAALMVAAATPLLLRLA